MQTTLFQGLNAIRRSHDLTFTERKHLEYTLSSVLYSASKTFTLEDVAILQGKRTGRNDPRPLNVQQIYEEASTLLTTVLAEIIGPSKPESQPAPTMVPNV